MPLQLFIQVTRRLSLPGVHSTYTSVATIMPFEKFEFGDYPPVASAYVTDSKTLVGRESQALHLQTGLTLVNDIITRLWEAKLERLYLQICTTWSQNVQNVRAWLKCLYCRKSMQHKNLFVCVYNANNVRNVKINVGMFYFRINEKLTCFQVILEVI